MKKEINANIERLRVIAALGIVAFHSQTGLIKAIGYTGLPIFILLTFFFVGKTTYDKDEETALSLLQYTKDKASRFLNPFVFWVIVYLLLDTIKAFLRHQDIVSALVADFHPLYGTSIHLWYLPFIFFALIMTSFFNKRTVTIYRYKLFILYALFGLLSAVTGLFLDSHGALQRPIPQYLYGLPAIFFGLTLGVIGTNKQKMVPTCLLIMVVAITGILRQQFLVPSDGFLTHYILAVFLVSLCSYYHGALDSITRKIAPLTLGIYLIHPAVLSVFHQVADVTYLKQYVFVVVFIISAGCISLLKITPLRRFV